MSATAETASTGPLTTSPHLNMLLHSVLSLQFNTGVSWRKGVSHTVMMVIPLFLMLFDSLLGFSLCNSLVYTYTTVIIYVYIYIIMHRVPKQKILRRWTRRQFLALSWLLREKEVMVPFLVATKFFCL